MYLHIKKEEEIKIRVGQDWFAKFDCARKIGNLDFCVSYKDDEMFGNRSLLWCEAKKGDYDIYQMFSQLILTIGSGRLFDHHAPPQWLAVFDAVKIVFVKYSHFAHLFALAGSFDWTATPSNTKTKEFKQIQSLLDEFLAQNQYLYIFSKHQNELKDFIAQNINTDDALNVTQIDNNNARMVYLQWAREVMPLINTDFKQLYTRYKILDCEFFFADLFVDDQTRQNISDNLLVIFKNDAYEIAKNKVNTLLDFTAQIKDLTKYKNFWRRYKRPPHKDWQEWILQRRDLFLPQDIIERKGAFFTPQPWVALSQEYLAQILGQTWQDEYYVWDCACGTGNLLAGLINARNIFASTLDGADVNHIHEGISKAEQISGKNKAHLLKGQVFQFDFLNDNFFDVYEDRFDVKTGKKLEPVLVKSKLPPNLQAILQDDAKRQKLLIYINPPYAEHGNQKTMGGTGKHKASVSNKHVIHEKYQQEMGAARRELFAQFLMRIYQELPNCTIANFSALKILHSPNFKKFRQTFTPKLLSLFLMISDTFDNVNGKFPIGFFIWDLKQSKAFTKVKAKVYQPKDYPNHKDRERFAVVRHPIKTKTIYGHEGSKINQWFRRSKLNDNNNIISCMSMARNDFHNRSLAYMQNSAEGLFYYQNITVDNLIIGAVYLAVHHCIKHTWLNHEDRFLHPKKSWLKDRQFHNDCLAYALFHGKNRISANCGVNHFIPFDFIDCGAEYAFASSFMYDFINGNIEFNFNNANNGQQSLNIGTSDYIAELRQINTNAPKEFSPYARQVFEAGLKLWQFYHAQDEFNEKTQISKINDASLYDIREYFQGRSAGGKMNNKSTNNEYNALIKNMRDSLNTLALNNIAPKVYEHGFLIA